MTYFLRLFPLLLALLLPLAACAADGTAPVEGRDYELIAEPGPFAPLAGKIEVVEVFGYPCIHCAHLEPTLATWKKSLPRDVQLTPVPAAFGGYWIPYARAFFAAKQLGVQERTHQAVFDALHKVGSLPIHNVSADELVAFYAGQGVDPERFRAALADPKVEAQLRRSAAFVRAAGLEGTPTLVVNGRYRVQARGFDDMLRTADWLIARERAAAKAAATSR